MTEPSESEPCVLYVEDEEVLREAGLAALAKAGFPARGACDGGEALRLFRAEPRRYPVVVLDWNLPGVSGLELVRELRTLHPEVRILLATAEDAGALPDLRASASWLRALRKPFRSYELLSQVAALFAQR